MFNDKSSMAAQVQAMLQQALTYHQSGELAQAQALYAAVLKVQPNNFDALRLLGHLAYQTNRHQMAAELTAQAIAINPKIEALHSILGLALQALGKLDEALSAYEKAIKIKPSFFEAYYNRGNVLRELKRPAEALRSYDKAISIKSDIAEIHTNRGLALVDLGQLHDALASYDKAISLKPNLDKAHNNRGIVLHDLKRWDEALVSYEKAISLNQNYADAHLNRGNTLIWLRRIDEALESYEKAIALRPDLAEAHYKRGSLLFGAKKFKEALISCDKAVALRVDHFGAHLLRGILLTELWRLDEALASYDEAIALRPGEAAIYIHRGDALMRLKRLDDAVANYDRLIALKPEDAEAYYARANAFNEAMQFDAARADFEMALQLKPDHYRARWALGFMDLPAIFRNETELESSRAAFAKALDDLDTWFDPSRLDGSEEAVATALPFQLAYHDANNKNLLAQYGRITCRLMAHWQHRNGINPTAFASNGKIKVGVVSSHVRDHSVWDAIAKGWLWNFDSDQFEWHVFSLGIVHNETTELIRGRANSFVENAGSLKDWALKIVESEIEVLIYPEVGMDQLTAKLASLRLAPLQIVSWGHPETTGFDTIDYFLSADLLEPETAASNYTETLVKLPNLGCTYIPHRISPVALDFSEFEIDDRSPILLCPGTIFKYSPKHDAVFPRIARSLGSCTFVFFEQIPHLMAVLKSRLKMAFEKENLVMDDYVKFIPWLSRERFYALMRRADVFMDTIGFSGFNTAMQAIESSLPVVTVEGRFMRGRLASGILRRLNLPELICDSESTYCDVVAHLVKDRKFRDEIVQKIENRRAILYNDMEPQAALEKFLKEKCRSS